MKRVINVLLIAVCIGMAVPIQAQVKLGVKGGLNLSKADFSGKLTDNLKSDNYVGFFIGPMVDFSIPIVGFAVDGALLYSQNGIKFDMPDNIGDAKLTQRSLEVPINLKYTLLLGESFGIFAAAGPQLGFDLDSDKKNFGIGEFAYKKTNISINLGIGMKLIKHLQAGINYNIPLGKTAEFKTAGNMIDGISEAKTKTWQISVAYLF